MAKAKILSVTQTEKAGLFTIIFEGESYDEFQKFLMKGEADARLQPDLQKILDALKRMLSAVGFLERYFRPEGKMRDRVAERKGTISIEEATIEGVDDKTFDI